MGNKEYYFTVAVRQKGNTVIAQYVFPKAVYKKEAKRKTEFALDTNGIDYDYVRVGTPFNIEDLPTNVRTEIIKVKNSSTLYLLGAIQVEDASIKEVVEISKRNWIELVDIKDGERKTVLR